MYFCVSFLEEFPSVFRLDVLRGRLDGYRMNYDSGCIL